jgi:adenylate cyclase
MTKSRTRFLEWESLGERTLKNIEGPVRVYRGRLIAPAGEAPHGASSTEAGPVPERREKPSIAVLPFANMSDESEQEHVTDGITDDIITDLSQVSDLIVIARSSTGVFKGKTFKIPDVGRELGVQYVLEGSVRKVDEQVRITAHLVDAVSGDNYGRSATIGN